MTTAAKGVRNYLHFFQQQKVASVLDYGAGRLRNTIYLTKHGFKVYAADLAPQVARIRTLPGAALAWGILDIEELQASSFQVDLVVSTYVLNILPNPWERNQLLWNCQAKLKPWGYFLIEVLMGDKLKNALSKPELDAMVVPFGFQRLDCCYGRNSIAVLYRKSPTQTAASIRDSVLTADALGEYNTSIRLSEMLEI